VPEAVLSRAQQLLGKLSSADITAAIENIAGAPRVKSKSVHYDEVDLSQMSLFDTVSDADVIKELSEMDLQTMTPIDALNELYRLQNKLNNRWKN
jgi:DNA mismatch repair protein MutS